MFENDKLIIIQFSEERSVKASIYFYKNITNVEIKYSANEQASLVLSIGDDKIILDSSTDMGRRASECQGKILSIFSL